MKIQGKTIIITGGGSGMGRELTLLLLKKSARVAAVDVNETALKETAELAGDFQERLSTHSMDITDRDAVSTLPEIVIQVHRVVDGVINNAGIIQRFVRVNDLDFLEMERVINVNFWGMVNVTKTILPHLLERPEAHIVNVSSMGGYLPVPGQTVYGASKAAAKLFTEGLRSELIETNVHVTAVFPGAMDTNIMVNSGVDSNIAVNSDKAPKFRMTSAATAAEIILEGIEKNRYHIMVGRDAKIMDRLVRLMPERAAKIIHSQMRSLLE
jgi:short-subunit dehydrogenase